MISYYIFSYYMFSDSVRPLSLPEAKGFPCYSITFYLPPRLFIFKNVFASPAAFWLQWVFGYPNGFLVAQRLFVFNLGRCS